MKVQTQSTDVRMLILEAKALPYAVLLSRLDLSEKQWLRERSSGRVMPGTWDSVQVFGDEVQGRMTGFYPKGSYQRLMGLVVGK